MIAWLWDIIVGQFCCHKWKIIGTGKCTMDGQPYGQYYDLQCEKCGKVKY
jgi:hypothetical protein